ncbi:MAG TPA: glycosyltransferase family A protein [Chitinophaga sp.]|uniref:glycosyltransferase family 2 protein n=1 Tax=Chitinophaga sp. TaxID=1869181 RepID=UPI002B569DB9|nr:glycosyltransferase family A protein [Chitinophaga sp.]HVI46347.1 glycosyltransferase family A protein [Chitinophaga sp.]
MVSKKISFCIVCMNRVVHLKETLPQNILDNKDYPNLEFVLLDYGSRDDLYHWADTVLRPHIASGRLNFFSTRDPEFFHMSHSKNMAFRLATGDILCSVDADNFTGPGFAAYVNEMFSNSDDIFLAPPAIGATKKWWDVQGRLCLWRRDFYKFRGYDERVMDYGYEDYDFKYRLEAGHRQRMVIRNPAFLKAIPHDDSLRISEGFSARKTRELLIGPVDHNISEVIYLQQNNIFERFYINNCLLQRSSSPDISAGVSDNTIMKPRHMYSGEYHIENNMIQLLNRKNEVFLKLEYLTPDYLLSSDSRNFQRVTHLPFCETFLLKRAVYLGRKVYSDNRRNGTIVNPAGFGRGTVFQNFSEEPVILSGDEVWNE